MLSYSILIILVIFSQCHSAAVYIVTPENTPLKAVSSTPKSRSSDLVFAEFKPGAVNANGKSLERMISVREMLDKEVVRKKTVTTTQKPQAKVEDVWDIIKHNQEQEIKHLKELTSDKKKPVSSTVRPIIKTETRKRTNIETIPSISLPEQEWKVSEIDSTTSEKKKTTRTSTISPIPDKKQDANIETIPSVSLAKEDWKVQIPGIDRLINISGDDPKPKASDDEERPRNIKTSDSWGYSYQNLDNDNNYYPQMTYDNNMNQAQDRFNPAQPYLPPRPSNDKPSFKAKPALPPPPVPMPPPPLPPPPKPVMSAPPMTYDSFPPYPPSSDDSGPPGFTSPPEDPPMIIPSDDHHHHHHHEDYKFELPPQHDHHHDHDIHYSDIDLESLQHFYHDHLHHHHEIATTTTPKPEMEESKVNNRYSYYYLGKKLWYLPLYFSVYFIIYVAVLIVKSIARHKITYPQHWKSKRSLDDSWKMSPESLNALTNLFSDAVINYGIKYLTNNNSEK